MLFLKEHLRSNHYDWSTGIQDNEVLRTPDRRRFDRLNGNQLLYLINSFGHSIGKLTIDDGLRIENLIMTELSPELKSELAVFNWLRGKYLYYWN
jgi:hypothetical protein